ncbi:class I SAM-dependent methyltransferase [Candidatus Pelagibacter sp.]|nr:class I SAM-dependent methyltransferase [Candidatus Pelagibacter sp.]
MKNNFEKYYDLIFLNKNYKKEVAYILQKTKLIKIKKILDVGCGTGTHSNLIYKNKKIKIFALDKNKRAIKIAKNKNKDIHFSSKNLKLLKENNFDLIISMFNVVNYFKDLKKLTFFFKEIKYKTAKNSLFIFDAWNGSFNFDKNIIEEERIIKNKNFTLINKIRSIKKSLSKKIYLYYKININFFKEGKKIDINNRLIQYLWTPKEIKNALIAAGFKSIVIKKSFSNKSFSNKDLKIIFLVS